MSPAGVPVAPAVQAVAPVPRADNHVAGGGDPPEPDYPFLVIPPFPADYLEDFNNAAKQIRLVLDVYDVATGTDPNGKIDAWIQKAVRRKPVFVSVPSLLLSEREVIRELIEFEQNSIKLVEKKLKMDVRRLRPFVWDTPETRQAGWAAVLRAEREVAAAISAAVEQANEQNWEKVSETSSQSTFRFNAGTAFKQAVEINVTGRWKGQ